MSDKPAADAPSSAPPGATGPHATTAGDLLRQARQSQGLHIAALAAAIKVVPRKLELLESDQYTLLPDATFTRALAQAVCRHLKVDSAPVLALLPPPNGHRLEQVSEGLKTTFHERPGRFVPREWASASGGAIWLAVLLLVAAVVLYVLPAGWLPATKAVLSGVAASAPVAQAASAAVGPRSAGAAVDAPSPSTVVTLVTPLGGEPERTASAARVAEGASAITFAPPIVAGTISGASAADVGATAASGVGVLQVHSSKPSWVEVRDAKGRLLLGRLVVPGETVNLDGLVPLKVRVGNASATELSFNGQPIGLLPFTRDNVARFDLK